MTTEEELVAVRRLLQEATEKAQRAEAELEGIGAAVVGKDWACSGPLLEQVKGVVEKAREVYGERAERILYVFGCAACHGEHRGIWTQELKPAVKRAFSKLELDAQRAYVCPSTLRVVLVSNESEETVAHDD